MVLLVPQLPHVLDCPVHRADVLADHLRVGLKNLLDVGFQALVVAVSSEVTEELIGLLAEVVLALDDELLQILVGSTAQD